MGTDLLIIFLLLAANGVFAMTELAVVSSKKARLKRLADEGDTRARAALALAEEPTRFLSTVQVGITLVGALGAVYSGDQISGPIEDKLLAIHWLQPHAHWLANGMVVVGYTFCAVVIGELVPKRLALWNPELFARFLARPVGLMARALSPFVSLLTASTNGILRLFNIAPREDRAVTDEEVVDLMQEGFDAGVFDETEQEMVESVLSLDSLAVKEIMTPRPKIAFLGKDDPPDQVWHKIVVSGHSVYPVYEGSRDNVVGIVSIKSLFANVAAGIPAKVKDLLIKPLVVPETQTVRQLLEELRKQRFHVALVADEFGGIAGLVTMSDVAEAVLGDFPTQHERLQPHAKQRDDGSWLIDGLYDVDELEETLDGLVLPREHGRDYQTLAGFVVTHISRVPTEGESFEFGGWRFEIIDMDRHRVDKVLVTRAAAPVLTVDAA